MLETRLVPPQDSRDPYDELTHQQCVKPRAMHSHDTALLQELVPSHVIPDTALHRQILLHHAPRGQGPADGQDDIRRQEYIHHSSHQVPWVDPKLRIKDASLSVKQHHYYRGTQATMELTRTVVWPGTSPALWTGMAKLSSPNSQNTSLPQAAIAMAKHRQVKIYYLKQDIALLYQVLHKHKDVSTITHVVFSIPECVEVNPTTYEMYDKNLDTNRQGGSTVLCLWSVNAPSKCV